MNTNLNRRRFLFAAAGAAAFGVMERPVSSAILPRSSIRAVAFDAFPIFDPRPVLALAEEIFPGMGAELTNAWRTRQFEYTWLRSVAGQYVDFWQITRDALSFAAMSARIEVTPERRDRLMNVYLNLPIWPDVPEAIRKLKAAGVRLGFLSNFTRQMLLAGLKKSGLEDAFEHLLSTDQVKQFKPAPRAYQMAVDAFGLRQEQIVFAAFAGWDAAGAKWFGFPTVWVNRLNAPPEELALAPDAVCHDLAGLVDFVASHR